MRAETVSEQLFFTTVRIEAFSGASSSVGTGFVYAVETNVGTVHTLVTNKHVLDGAAGLRVTMVRNESGGPQLGQGTQITIDPFGAEAWVGHPDPEVDVAVMPLGEVFSAMADNSAPPFFRSLSPSVLASPELIGDLDAIEAVTFVGYPNGLFDTANLLPIARRGTTATPVGVDYQGKPAFLIDASVFPGSSGSPVFLLDRGMYQDRQGNSIVGGRFACLGIVAAVHVRQLEGAVVEVKTGLGVKLAEPIDLGIVYKAATIDEVVDVFLTNAGVERQDIEPTAPPGEITEADQAIADETAGEP